MFFKFSGQNLTTDDLKLLASETHLSFEIENSQAEKITASQRKLMSLFEMGTPIYGVTTGFGDSCHRVIEQNEAHLLQHNLISYLRCGTGEDFSEEVGRLVLRLRLISLSRGLSGVSLEMIKKMSDCSEKAISPRIPKEGSLGASGDLVPLAYVASMLEGRGPVYFNGKSTTAEALVEEGILEPYKLQPKEGLAIVNGTTVMLAQSLLNTQSAKKISDLSTLFTSWLCLALGGKTEAFEEIVNARANQHAGQKSVAEKIRKFLSQENYSTLRATDVGVNNGLTVGFVQDRYSLRCAPQILGPVVETIELSQRWLSEESNGVSDNPLFGDDFRMANGGNFYGGYVCHAMDYVKVSVAQIADLMDRQLTFLCDEKSNRGLPPNLANWPGLTDQNKHLHHGLKGLHQAASAITSEIMAMAIPNGIFSRSTESHNQDKVSLGTSASVQCDRMLAAAWNLTTLYAVSVAQALDLKQVKLMGPDARKVYDTIRAHVPFIAGDQVTDYKIKNLCLALKEVIL
jgi:histidine ammonia-lyase/phenylalanine ammonia-lyase